MKTLRTFRPPLNEKGRCKECDSFGPPHKLFCSWHPTGKRNPGALLTTARW